MELRGAYTALITPFKEDGKIDYDGLVRNIHHQMENRITGIVPLGTTGETPTLSRAEQDEIIRISVREAKGRMQIIVGCGSNSTEHTVENVHIARDMGADAALIVTPYYNKPTDEGVYRHFCEISTRCDIPVVVYNIQGRTGKNITPDLMQRIATLGNVIGVKEASGDLDQMARMIDVSRTHDNFNVVSGDDAYALDLIAIGGTGVISVVSNLLPAEVSDLVAHALDGDYCKAKEMHEYLLPIFKGAFIETNPIPIKEAMNYCGMPAGGYRLPLCEMMPENRDRLHAIIDSMDIRRRIIPKRI